MSGQKFVCRILDEIVRNISPSFIPLFLVIMGEQHYILLTNLSYLSHLVPSIHKQLFVVAGNITKYAIKYTITLICKASCFWVLESVIRLVNFIVMLIPYFLISYENELFGPESILCGICSRK